MTDELLPQTDRSRETRILGFARACFRTLIEELLDDPSFLIHPDDDYNPADELAFYRLLAADIGLDFDELVAEGSPEQRERIAKLERGELI